MVVNCKSLLAPYIKREGLIQTYLNDIRKYEILSKEEERELLYKVHDADPAISKHALDKLINHNQRFVTSVAIKYTNGNDLLDLINQGNLGLMEAIKKFDVVNNENVRLITYAVWWIQKSINEYIVNYANIVTPLNVVKLKALARKIQKKFFNTEGRTPTTEELHEILEKDYNINVKYLYDLETYKCISIDSSFSQEDDSDDTFSENSLFNTYTATNNVSEDCVIRDKKKLIKNLLNQLTERERTILTLSFGLNGNGIEETHYTIADKLGLTKERVRQIEKEALSKLSTFIQDNKILNI